MAALERTLPNTIIAARKTSVQQECYQLQAECKLLCLNKGIRDRHYLKSDGVGAKQYF